MHRQVVDGQEIALRTEQRQGAGLADVDARDDVHSRIHSLRSFTASSENASDSASTWSSNLPEGNTASSSSSAVFHWALSRPRRPILHCAATYNARTSLLPVIPVAVSG